ncbi:hypothetical protein CBR_g40256 [Chara braunii]|uniref:Reverse transcriptase/retrotransposon-derived protein RNase H-like domain-containing protein n=1 Tax=Chara braunii TaxID=69332 RepID=A0A388K1T1_CHABU|nr:hypothetical protein CBR_g40256 [Chara braunii]|eukprot:GBG64011.1 hypothetical protein CBR_g40256 [Chara braunii]
MPVDVKDGVSVVLPEDGAWTDLEPAYQTVMLKGEDAFLWIETVWANVNLTRLSPSLMDLEFRGTVEARGWVYLSKDGENAMVVELALGNAPDELFRKAEAEVVWVSCQRREMEMERAEVRVELGDRGSMRRPVRTMRCVLPPFLVDAVFETRSRLVRICQSMMNLGLYQCARQDFFRLSVEMGSFEGNWADELTEILSCLSLDNIYVSSPVHWGIVYRNMAIGETFLEGVKELFYDEEDDFRLWSLRERVLGWLDSEGTTKTRGGQKASKEGPDTGVAGEASSSEGGLRKIVSSLARALNKNQGYLADAKKKLTFDGENITEFLIDYENLAALLKWTEEEKMDHLGQHVSLSLGRDIIPIVASSRSWKETGDVMMRKYLAAEKMATEADLAAVQRKNFATYNDFLREFTLVALRIPGVTDRIMSTYFLRQFSEFDKDKILSAYQQTSKFVNTRDVDFSMGTDLAEKTVVTETLALLKEGEIIDLTSRTDDKPDPTKTDKISQRPTPLRTTTEVRAFLGVVDFWRIFIKNFAKIAEPIRTMIREEGTMDWTEEREGAVQTLKDVLTSEQVALSAPCFNDEVGQPFILETDGGPLAVGGVLIQRDEGGKERPIRFESRTLNSAERRYSQFKKEVLAILHCLKTFQVYLFGRRFILRIDPTNVAGALKNYKPIDPMVGRWVGFIWQLDYKIEQIAGIRNKADGLSRVCITPEGVEDAEPIDAFLEFEGGTLAVDNEVMDEGCASVELLIRTLEKGAPAVVAELREGPVTTRGRKEERESWGAIVGPKLDDDPRMTTEELIEARCQQVFKNEEVMEDIANRVLDSRMRDKARWDQGLKERKMEFGNENDSGAINRSAGGEEAGSSQGRRTAKRKLYIGLMGGPVVSRGGRKCLCRRPSPLRKGEGIKISSGSEGERGRANMGGRGDTEMRGKARASDEERDEECERREPWDEERGERQDMRNEQENEEEKRESTLEGKSGHGNCEGYGTGTKIPFTYDPKNLAGGYSPIQTEDEEDEEEDVQEVIEISSGDERDEISRPREERRPPMHQPGNGAFRWEDEFGPTPSHRFQQ